MHALVRAMSLVTMTIEASLIARVKWSLPLSPETWLSRSTSALIWPSRSRSKVCRSAVASTALKSRARPYWWMASE
ncbi:hypothetical protein D3C81_2179640 [compost metagenome]